MQSAKAVVAVQQGVEKQCRRLASSNGLRVVHGGGVFTTVREYSIAMMALAALALVGTLARRSSAVLAAPALAASRR
jgi:hypothetical protein